MNTLRIALQKLASIATVFTAMAIASASVDADDHSQAEALSIDHYRLSASVSVLTAGCKEESGPVRVDRRNQRILFLGDDANVSPCAIETWVAPTTSGL